MWIALRRNEFSKVLLTVARDSAERYHISSLHASGSPAWVSGIFLFYGIPMECHKYGCLLKFQVTGLDRISNKTKKYFLRDWRIWTSASSFPKSGNLSHVNL